MNTNLLKNGIIIILAAALAYNLYSNPLKEKNNIADLVNIEQKPPVVYSDPQGKTHVQKEIKYVNDSEAEMLYKSQRDSLARLVDVQKKQIIGLVMAGGEAQSEFNAKVEEVRDSANKVLGNRTVYQSKWLDFYSEAFGSGYTRVNQRDSVILGLINRPTGFIFKRNRYFLDLHSANPDMKYTNINGYMELDTERDRGRFGFDITAGLGVFRYDKKIVTGFGVMAGVGYRFR